VGGAPRTPYPPDLADDAAPARALSDLIDVVLQDLDLANAAHPRVALRRVELRRCRLTGAELGEATLTDVVFDECRLDLAALRYAKLERVAFRDCRMAECDLAQARLADVLFERCELREATLSGVKLERVELSGCDLLGMHGAESLRGARVHWSDVVANAPVFALALGIEILD
jgi:uncharacterized protein YjbI with pentapeptide repeats